MKLNYLFFSLALAPFTISTKWREKSHSIVWIVSMLFLPSAKRVQLKFCVKLFFRGFIAKSVSNCVIFQMQRKRSWRIPKVFRQCVLEILNLIIFENFLNKFSSFFRYVPPINASTSPNLPETVEDIQAELRKQESLLSQIHSEMNAGLHSKKREEELWEVQRIITQLKVNK